MLKKKSNLKPDPTKSADLRNCIDHCIKVLKSYRKNINNSNYHLFNINMTEHRNLDPIRTMNSWGNVVGFEQKSGITLQITIVDNRKKGHTL